MSPDAPPIVVVDRRIHPDELARLVNGRDRCIEYAALINIRPAQDNRSMLIEDPAPRERVRDLTYALIGEGEPLG